MVKKRQGWVCFGLPGRFRQGADGDAKSSPKNTRFGRTPPTRHGEPRELQKRKKGQESESVV